MTTLADTGYRATRTDAELVVHDVEIFCACERDDFQADERWVMEAFRKAKAEATEGYHPPLHIRHHERETAATDSVKSAGTFEVTAVRPITLAGKRRNAIFVDFHVTDREVADDLLAGKYPYRSVEIFDADAPPSIDGLALLDHEAPFLRLPMLMVSDLNDRSSLTPPVAGKVWAHTLKHAASFKAGRCINPLSFEETNMTATVLPKTETFGDGITKPVNLADDDKPKDDKPKDDDGGEDLEGDMTIDVSGIVKAIEKGTISIADMDAILAAIQGQGAEKEEPEAQPEPTPAPGAEAMMANTSDSLKFAALQGEVDALKAEGQTRDANDQRKTDVAEALQRLEGRPMGADLEGKLASFHEEHGPAAFKAYVDQMVETFAASPRAAAATLQDTKTPDVCMQYADRGPGEIDRAANFARQHAALASRGLTTSLENYLDINMNATQEIGA